MTQVAIWANPQGGVCVCWPAQGVSADVAAQASAPAGAAYFIKDSESLPLDVPQERWLIDASGNVSIDPTPILPATLKRSQVMRQLATDGKLDGARAIIASDQTPALTKELWKSEDWHLEDVQSSDYAPMISALGINIATFWANAAHQKS